MTTAEVLLLLAASLVAGGMNAVVGGGSLLTFPALLAVGLSPLQANVTNTVGILPGSIGAVVGYRRELASRRSTVRRLAAFSAVGSVIGAVLLLVLPSSAFDAVVPVLLVLSAVLTLVQPVVARRLAGGDDAAPHGGPWLSASVLLTGVYGGYFGAAQGVILLALLGTLLTTDLQVANAVKNVLALVANTVAAVIFVIVADVDWPAAIVVAIGATFGGVVGARLARRLPATALRVTIVVVALITAAVLVVRG